MRGFALIPEQASSIAPHVDRITLGLVVLSFFILAIVFGLQIIFGVLYRKGSPRSRKMQKKGNWILEWGWTFITLFAFLAIFGWAALIYFNMHTPPSASAEIMVIGKQWMWKIQHPNGKREIDEMHVPVGESILLTMTSQDVIHSFFVPEFRIKQDVLPDRYTRIWFQANRLGEYHLFCAEYCGTMHSKMRGKVIVMTKSAYQQWLQSGIPSDLNPGNQLSMASRGAQLFTRMGCISCHGKGSNVQAPSLDGIFGKPVSLSNGARVIADENYLRESILNPQVKITQGYQPIMPPFAGLLNEENVLDLIAYIKTLGGTPKTQSEETQ